MILDKKLWMIVWLGVSIVPRDVYSSDHDEDHFSSSSSLNPVPKETKKRSRDIEVSESQREVKKPRLNQEQSQIYATPIYIKKVMCINILESGSRDTQWTYQTFKKFTAKDQDNDELEDGIESRHYSLFYKEISQDEDLMTKLTK